MAEMLAQTLDGGRHHVPVILASEQSLSGGRSLIEPDAGIENRGIGDIFLCLLAWECHAALLFGEEEDRSLLVDLVVAPDPALKTSLCAAGESLLDLVFVALG